MIFIFNKTDFCVFISEIEDVLENKLKSISAIIDLLVNIDKK